MVTTTPYGGETGGTFKAELKQVFTSADTTWSACITTAGSETEGKLDTDCCIVFEIENGRMTSCREHFFDVHNWDEFWS